MKKRLPNLKSNKEAEDFIKNADLKEYDLPGGKHALFEFQKKDKATHSTK
ncbi:MAG: hypothetical protein GY777_26635 [Candidatus Brocadiaceae bacterium]|nr:hypothetical protein [Candidatus Brocadiaceae bacterium]